MDTEITAKTKEEETGGQMTFFEHLIELRKRIINSLIAIALGAAEEQLRWPHSVELVRFVLFKPAQLEVFQAALQALARGEPTAP